MMGDVSKIEWLNGGHTASPWHGCAHVHEGCTNCYAETMSKRNPATLGVWGENGTRVMSASFATNCRRWNKQAKAEGVIRSVFPSICDPFEDWQGPILNAKGQRVARDTVKGGYTTSEFHIGRDLVRMDDLRRDLFSLIDECQSLCFYLLTKRPENIRRMWPRVGFPDTSIPGTIGRYVLLENVWLLTSVSNQATADAMIPPLLACRDLCPVLGISMEPLLGPVDLRSPDRWAACDVRGGINWIIVGGESGYGARPMHPDWARSIRDQCVAAGVPFFMKQWGEFAPIENHRVKVPAKDGGNYGFIPSGEKAFGTDKRELHVWHYTEHDNGDSFSSLKVGKKAAGRILDGRTWDEYPKAGT